MKSNAIIRIIIWSLVLVVLVGILSIGLGVTRILPSRTIAASPAESIAPQRIEETHVPLRITEPTVPQRIDTTLPDETKVPLSLNYEVKEATNIRATPSPMGNVLGAVEAGEHVELVEDRTISGRHWGRIKAPEDGWILLGDNVEEAEVPSEDSTPTATISTDAPFYAFETDKIKSIGIEWAAGTITILPTEGSQILVSETGDTAKRPMEIKQKKDKLSIEFSEGKFVGIGIHLDSAKDLQILVPKDMLVSELDIDAASATVQVRDLNIQEMEFDGADGACEFENCNINKLDIDTASGDIHFTGTLNVLECDAASASFVGILSNVPRTMEMESMSGNLDVTLPSDAGFTVTMEGMNSDFSSDFETTSRNGSHIHGDGACRIQMEAMNGDVIIRKAK